MITDTRLIPLTQSQFAIVDACDFEWLNQFSWYATKRLTTRGIKYYAVRFDGRKCLYMHRIIAERAFPDFVSSKDCDHRDGQRLNNSRQNLRLCTTIQNCRNSRKAAGKLSSFKGVTWHKLMHKWEPQIRANGKNHHLGFYASEIEAAAVYAAFAIFYFGPFACFD